MRKLSLRIKSIFRKKTAKFAVINSGLNLKKDKKYLHKIMKQNAKIIKNNKTNKI